MIILLCHGQPWKMDQFIHCVMKPLLGFHRLLEFQYKNLVMETLRGKGKSGAHYFMTGREKNGNFQLATIQKK